MEAKAPQNIELLVDGMHCASCVGRVEKALSVLPQVKTASVNLATDRATVTLVSPAESDILTKALENAGYRARVLTGRITVDDVDAHRREETARLRKRFVLGLILTLPVAVLEMGAHFYGLFHHSMPAEAVVFLLTTAVVVFLGGPFLRRALKDIRAYHFTMETLISLGVGTAFVYSSVVLLGRWAGIIDLHRAVYFESAAVILTLVTMGKWLESLARLRAAGALRSLLELEAKTALLYRGGRDIEVPVSDLRPGDMAILRAGEKVPADGLIVEGEGSFDESMLTGESLPITKAVGAKVIGGTLCLDGLLLCRLEATGSDTVLARIIAHVSAAQQSKAAIQRTVDRVTQYFVPGVIAVALSAFLGWGLLTGMWTLGFLAAVAVLIIACPCALGLATPIALMVGSARGAREGILLRDAIAVEAAGNIDTICFDKTGTLTVGAPVVFDRWLDAGADTKRIMDLALSLEASSTHPLAKAICAEATSQGGKRLPVSELVTLVGRGLNASIEGVVYMMGSARFIEEDGAVFPKALQSSLDAWRHVGGSAVLLAERESKRVLAAFALRDEVRPEAAKVLKQLRDGLGLKAMVLTGDHPAAANAIGRALGFADEEIFSALLPEMKVERVRELQNAGRRVAFVGDGINDAPSLAQADLGIAIGSGADAAMTTAAMTLMGGHLDGVERALRLGRETRRKIHQNLFWAFAYNTTLIPIAALGYLSPMLAGVAMALSSVSVVGNSLLLNRGGR